MATPQPQSRPPRKDRPGTRRPVTYNRNEPGFQTVDPKFLMRALPVTIFAAFVCAYLAMCLLFWQGSWQLILHPAHTGPAGTGLPAESVRFGVDEGGQPQIQGEFLPAAPGSASAATTVLYLRPGDGALDAADAPLISVLHDLGLNVLSFDYRGMGRSAPKPHPNQERMQEDAAAAWSYLTGLRRIPPGQILVYGAGIGASLALHLAADHHEAAAVILRNADADVLGTVRREPRSRLFPVSVLFHDRFPLDGLKTLAQPKLLLDIGPNNQGPEEHARQAAYRSAADPKMLVELPATDPEKEREAMKRFLQSQTKLHAGAAVDAAASCCRSRSPRCRIVKLHIIWALERATCSCAVTTR